MKTVCQFLLVTFTLSLFGCIGQPNKMVQHQHDRIIHGVKKNILLKNAQKNSAPKLQTQQWESPVLFIYL